MPATPQNMKVTIAPPADPRFTELFQVLENNIEVQVPDGFLMGEFVTSLPSTDVGMVIYGGKIYLWDDDSEEYSAMESIGDIGAVEFFAHNNIDASHYLRCDGTAVSRVTYGLLYAKIGTTFGNGDGSTTFALPDLRGRGPIGAGTGSSPGAGGGPASTLTPRTLGQALGEESHALIAAEVPAIDNTAASKAAATGSDVGFSATAGTKHNNMQPSIALVACIRFA